MNITKKIVVGGAIIVILAIITSGIFSILVSEEISNMTIHEAERANAAYIKSIASQELTMNDFEAINFDERKTTFENYFQSVENDNTLRIKVWSKDGTIVYSDDSSIVGENFADNIRFQNSINGQLVSEIKDPVDPENIAETGYGQLMEIYVPIYLNQSEPVGVIELYFSMDSINQAINKASSLVYTIILILIGLLSLAILVFL